MLYLDDIELEKTYPWDLGRAVKEYRGRRDILPEVRRYHESPSPRIDVLQKRHVKRNPAYSKG